MEATSVAAAGSATITVSRVMDQVREADERLKGRMTELRDRLRILLDNPQHELFQQLAVEQNQLQTTIQQQMRTLDMIHQQVILLPLDLYYYDEIYESLHLLLCQLQLYQNEMLCIQAGSLCQNICQLVIMKQPFPQVYFKEEQLQENHLVLKLLVGAGVDVAPTNDNQVQAALHGENFSSRRRKKKGKVEIEKAVLYDRMIEGEIQMLDPLTRLVYFPLRFLKASDKKVVKLQFITNVQVNWRFNNTTISETLHV